VTDMLDKPFGAKRPQAQKARNAEAFRRLDAGTLGPGELYALATGKPAGMPAITQNPVTLTGKRTVCLDCKQPLEGAGPPLESQPRRCLICGQLKRREHNQRLKQKRAEKQAAEAKAS